MAEPTIASQQDIGQFMVQQGLLTPAQLTSAQAQAKQTGRSVARSLVELEIITEEDLTRSRAQQWEIPYLNLQDVTVDRSVLGMVDPGIARRLLILPIGRKQDGTLRLIVGTWNTEITEAAQKISAANRCRIAPALATEANVRAAIEQHYPVVARQAVAAGAGPPGMNARAGDGNTPPNRSAVPAVIPPSQTAPSKWTPNANAAPAGKKPSEMFASSLPAAGNSKAGLGPDNIEEAGVDQPLVIQFVNRILSDAITKGASDIHLEPRRDKLDIRYRIDGTLHYIDSIRHEYQAACTSRVKIMADMNIAERRLPQDGRIAVTIGNRSVDMRVSSLPCQYGESVVLRILDKGGTRPTLDQLGFSERNLRIINSLIRKPHGIFLATGPTGSGKTTTLYSAVQEIHTPEVNIMTVEDPIEYDLDGIRQSNVHEKAGLTFARQLRAILRQDPDIIYVGEIRDAETAEIAFRAALTGHLVFSTLHCNDAAGAITRLLNMDQDPFLVSSTVVGVMAQRLVRRVCPTCTQPYVPTPNELKAFGVDLESREFRNANFQMGAGCELCDNTGYRGRYSIQEIMVMDDNIRNMVLARTPSNKIRTAAIAHGMVSMRQDAANKVMEGVTTFEEAQKRVFIEEAYEDQTPTF